MSSRLLVLALAFAAAACKVPVTTSRAQPQAPVKAPASSSDTTPELWNGARLGMTIDETKAAFPAAKVTEAPKPERFGSPLLHAENVEVARRSADVTFYFVNERLSQVSLDLKATNAERALSQGDFDALRAGLQRKYGEPVKCDVSDASVVQSCDFTSAGIDVNLVGARKLDGNFDLLDIIYLKSNRLKGL